MTRIAPLPVGEWPPQMREALAALDPPARRHPLPKREGRPKALNALGTLARHPGLARAFHTFNGHVLFATTITPRQRELLVLRVAALRSCDYEWAQHVVQARDAGIADEEIRRVAAGPNAGGWDPFERHLLLSVDELIGVGCVSDDTWRGLAAELDDQQLMDVVFTVGAYEVLAMAFRSFGVPLDPDLEPYLRERPSH